MLRGSMRLQYLALLAFLSLSSFAARAQSLPGGAQLGMSLPQLQQSVAGAHAVAHPSRMTGGLVGSWSGPAVDVAGVALTPVFFFASGELRRIEYTGNDGFDALLAWGRASWGPELASQNPEGAYASWSTEEMDAYLQQTGARVRLVIKKRVLKDASEL